MTEAALIYLAGMLGFMLLIFVGCALLYRRLYQHVPQGSALVVSSTRGDRVHFGGALVLPVVEQAEILDIRQHKLPLEKTRVRFADGLCADLALSIVVRINRTREDVLRVVRLHGVTRASDPEYIADLLAKRLDNKIELVCDLLPRPDRPQTREKLLGEIYEVLDVDLDGFFVHEVIVERFVPLDGTPELPTPTPTPSHQPSPPAKELHA